MTRYAALLRGINVGTAKRIAMADLRDLCEQLGFDDVSTLLNSGNVILESRGSAATVGKKITAGIADRFGIDVQVVVRTGEQLQKVIEHDPYSDIADPLKYYSVTFLAEPLAAKDLPDPSGFAPEQFEMHGQEIYFWLPAGQIESRLMKVMLATKLPVVATNRNWNTVSKLAALTA